jgi:hypothetical protein
MGQDREREHGKGDFTYRGESIALVMSSDNHLVALLEDLWVGPVTFEKGPRGGRPTSVEIVAFPIAKTAPVSWGAEALPPVQSSPRPPREAADRRGRQPARQAHKPVRNDSRDELDDDPPPRQKKAVTTNPVQTPDEPARVKETAAAPSGMDRFRARYGDLNLDALVPGGKRGK